MSSKKNIFSKFINFIRKACKRKNKKNCADIKKTNSNIAASGDSLYTVMPSKCTTKKRTNDKVQDLTSEFIHPRESIQGFIKNGSVPIKRENEKKTIADKITDLKESIKDEILNDPKIEIIIRNHIQGLTSEHIQGMVHNCLMESTDYLIKSSGGQNIRKEDEINENKKLTDLKKSIKDDILNDPKIEIIIRISIIYTKIVFNRSHSRFNIRTYPGNCSQLFDGIYRLLDKK
ncbi:uncharacterized protein LOC126910583 [Daktulosphaira vitifoliae]|uniref:uncharacterized protein LOC126910583 n=1 Tax=Daktulosphaira vitifoliae TaxID=58002 RepID=UPI0021A9EDE7|nr:uncharacterized protein LOC126910583 [Daktulosphaira vitifoliae]